MKKIAIATAVLACYLNAAAQNSDGFYYEAAYSNISIKDASSDNLGTWKPSAIRMTFGGVMVDNIALEGFVVQGLQSDTLKVYGSNLDVSVKTSYGIALRPFVNLSNNVELYGRLGTIRLKSEGLATYNGIATSTSAQNTHSLYGVGLGYKLKDNLKFVADYTKLSTFEETKSSLISVGVRFGY